MTTTIGKELFAVEVTEEQPIIERVGKMRYASVKHIEDASTLRLDNEMLEERRNKKFAAFLESVKVEGILTPLIVRKNKNSKIFDLIDGDRRLRAARIIGLKKVPVIVYDENKNKSDLLRIIANSNQKKATPIELAMAYKRLLESGAYDSNRELAVALGVSESTVGTRINNLKLDKNIIESLVENNESILPDQKVLKSIRTIEKVNAEGVSQKQWEVYSYIVENDLSRKEALEYIKEQKGTAETKRFVKLESNNKINVMIDTSGLDETRVLKIEELLAEIEALRIGSEN